MGNKLHNSNSQNCKIAIIAKSQNCKITIAKVHNGKNVQLQKCKKCTIAKETNRKTENSQNYKSRIPKLEIPKLTSTNFRIQKLESQYSDFLNSEFQNPE